MKLKENGLLTVLGDLVQFRLTRFLLLTSIRTCIRMVTFQGKYSEICRSPDIGTNGGNKILLDIDSELVRLIFAL